MFAIIFRVLLFCFIVLIISLVIFLLYVLYKLYLAKDPLPKVSRIVLVTIHQIFIGSLFLFAGMMFLVIVYVIYKVFSLKEPIVFQKK